MSLFRGVSLAAFCIVCLPTCMLATTLAINPPSLNASPGSNFSVDVMVTGVTDLADYQFDVGYDPKILNATGITEGLFLSTAGTTLFLPGTIDNVAGTITFTADGLVGPVPGASGDGILATISFTAVGPGTSAINLFNQTLLDSTFSGLPVDLANSSVSVSGVPEPATLFLFGAGMLALAVGKFGAERRGRWRA